MSRCFVVLDRTGSFDLRQALRRAREALTLGGSREIAHELVRPPFAALVLAHDPSPPILERAGEILIDVGPGADPGGCAEFLAGCDRMFSQDHAAPPALRARPMKRCLIRWLPERQRLLVVAEPNGQVPIYYRHSGERVLVASEAKAIVAADPATPSIDVDGLLELIELGQPLAERTIFRDLASASPGALLAFDPSGLAIRTYHAASFSESRNGDARASAVALNRALEAVLHDERRVHPSVTVALSGGMDSRHLLAAARPLWVSLDAVTFGETGSHDVEIARRVATIARVPHHVHAPSEHFLSDWAGYAVWRTDGMLSCLHAHGMDAVIARSGESRYLLNGAGGDVLLGAFLRVGHLLLPGDPARAARYLTRQAHGPDAARALKPEVLGQATTTPRATLEAILRRYPSERLGNLLLAYWLRHRCARVTALGISLEAPFVEHLTPFLDPRFVTEAARLSLEARFMSRAHRRALGDLSPELACVPWERLGMAPRWPWPVLGLAKLGRRLGLIARSKPAVDHARRLRTTLKPWVDGLLLDPRTLGDGFFLPGYLREIVAQHQAETHDRTAEICLAATVELWRRIFIERDLALAAPPVAEAGG